MTNHIRGRVVVGCLAACLVLAGTPAIAVGVVAPTISAISAGGFHFTCAVTSRGAVKCWGDNQIGQLGNGSTTSSLVPVDVSGLTSGVTAIAAGSSHACALTIGGAVLCWGNNYNGQLGDGSRANSLVPVRVGGLASGVAAIAAGYYDTCALTKHGAVFCWGFDFTSGPLRSVPAPVVGLTGPVSAIAAGSTHSCALLVTGGVMCWGLNEDGRLGTGATDRFSGPVAVEGLSGGVSAISTGDRHTCAVMTSGPVRCWGSNGYGQLGDGTRTSSAIPVAVAGLSGGVKSLAAGYLHTCALTSGGRLSCWGQNAYGQLGNGFTSATASPVDVVGLQSGVAAVSSGDGHTCAVTTTGKALCWGRNSSGQLGTGTRTNGKVPAEVDFGPRFTIEVGASEPAGTLRSGTTVTFSVAVAVPGSSSPRATVRFEIYRLDNGIWRRTAHRDVATTAAGRATLGWTFVSVGSRYVRAMALETAQYEASRWSTPVSYQVR